MNNFVEVNLPQNLTIKVTPAALAHIQKCLDKRGKGIGLRLHVTEAGCSGYRYDVSYVDEMQANDKVFPINETLSVYVDKQILSYIIGTTIDYQKEGLNSRLIFDNPNQTGNCGCGESFTVD